MKTIKKLLRALPLLALVAFMPTASYALDTLTQTTLAGAIAGGPMGQISAGTSYQTTICLASVTGILPQGQGNFGGPNQFQTAIYVDKELMYVISVNTTSKCVVVLRAQSGTQAVGHVNGDMVLFGGLNDFFTVDPDGNCTAAAIIATPYINVLTGNEWLCSTVTLGWIPGFGNTGTSDKPISVNTAVASAAGQVTPSGPLFHITGALAITGWLIPIGCNATVGGGCSFTVIPDAAFTTTATNNIATAVTAVINLPITWTWDATNSKFVSMQSK